MKKLFLIAVTLFAVATTQAQTTNDVIDTLETSSQYARGKVVLPENIANNMFIERSKINDVDVLVAEFSRKLTEKEIELVKTYVGFYYERCQPKGKKYNTSAPDIRNTKKRCTMTFYKH